MSEQRPSNPVDKLLRDLAEIAEQTMSGAAGITAQQIYQIQRELNGLRAADETAAVPVCSCKHTRTPMYTSMSIDFDCPLHGVADKS